MKKLAAALILAMLAILPVAGTYLYYWWWRGHYDYEDAYHALGLAALTSAALPVAVVAVGFMWLRLPPRPR